MNRIIYGQINYNRENMTLHVRYVRPNIDKTNNGIKVVGSVHEPYIFRVLFIKTFLIANVYLLIY